MILLQHLLIQLEFKAPFITFHYNEKYNKQESLLTDFFPLNKRRPVIGIKRDQPLPHVPDVLSPLESKRSESFFHQYRLEAKVKLHSQAFLCTPTTPVFPLVSFIHLLPALIQI